MKLDLLAFAAHPDDVELSCAGTIILHGKAGYKTGVIDISRGELGTRGTAEIREREAKAASVIMGISIRENLDLPDGFFEVNEESRLAVIRMLRKYRPEIVLANAFYDRHPDHGRASLLVSESCFLSGLTKVTTTLDNTIQEAWRPKAVYHYIQDRSVKPDVIVDISSFMEQREQAINAFSSQFYNPTSTEPDTMISSKQFLEGLHSRAIEFGRMIGVEYGEGFLVERSPGVKNLFELM